MAGDVHKLLVTLGEKWLKRQGFAVVASELICIWPTEGLRRKRQAQLN